MNMFKKSAEVKLKLLLSGITINSKALNGLGTTYKEFQYGYNDSNWLRKDRQELIPSELVLPGEIVVAPHLRPSSPYCIEVIDGTKYIVNHETDEVLSEVNYLPRPKLWNKELSNGESIKKYLNVYGKDCLNLFIVSDCDFWNTGKPCVFCSLKPTQTFHNQVVKHKDIDRIDEALKIAFRSGDKIEWMIITGGSLMSREEEVERYCQVLNCIKKHIPCSWNGKIRGNAALMPDSDIKSLKRLFDTGISHPSFNLEVWDEVFFTKLCPGKSLYVGFKSLLKTYKNAVDIWGKGEVWCNFVGGISPINKLKDGFKFMADLGVVPGANIFHIDPYAPAARMGLEEPSEDYVLEMYHTLGEIFKEYHYSPFFSYSVLRNSLANEAYHGWI